MCTAEDFRKCLQLLKEFVQGNDQALEAAFKLIDRDGSGKIDFSELNAFLEQEKGGSIQAAKVHEVIQQVDKDGDGKIDLGEFRKFLTTKRAEQQD